MTTIEEISDIKDLLTNSLSHKQRLEIIKHLDSIGKFDIIGRLPTLITAHILTVFSPKELCRLRLVSRIWNKKTTHDSLWIKICKDYSIIPLHKTFQNSNIPIFHNLFQRSLTMTKNWKTLKCKRIELKYHKGPVLSLLIAHSTRIFTGDVDGAIHVWNAQNEEYIKSIQSHTSHVSCLAHSHCHLASGSSDTTIVIHDVLKLQPTRTISGHQDAVTALAFSKNSQNILFSGSVDRTVRIWDLGDNANCLGILHGQESTISFLHHFMTFPSAFCQSEIELNSVMKNKSGYIVSGSSDQNIFIWDLKTLLKEEPVVMNAIMETNGPVTALAVYDEVSGYEDFPNPSSMVNEYVCARRPIHVPPFIAYAGLADSNISIFSVPGFEKTFVESPTVHRGTIWSISCAPIHSKIVTTSGDRTVIVWDLKSPETSTTLGGFDSAVVSSAISQQEDILCFGTEKGTIVLFDLQEPI